MIGHANGYLTSNGLMVEVWANDMKPRLPGDGCGCKREVRWTALGTANVVKLCDKHAREPGILRYMLP